jgi:uncharacterized membrane protein
VERGKGINVAGTALEKVSLLQKRCCEGVAGGGAVLTSPIIAVVVVIVVLLLLYHRHGRRSLPTSLAR